MSQIAGAAPVASTPGQTGVEPGSTAVVQARQQPGGGPAFANGSLWAAQVVAANERGFVLLVAGVPFDIDGPAPGPTGTPLLVRASMEDGQTVFDVVSTSRTVRPIEALRVALGHMLHRALGAAPPPPLRALDLSGSRALGAELTDAVRQRLAEPTATLADYLARGILRLDLPVTGTSGDCTWQIEVQPDEAPDGAAGERACSVTLFTTLPSTGPVEARLTLTRAALAVRIVLASDEACKAVGARLAELEATLAGLGFPSARVAVVASPARLARDRATDAVPHEAPAAGGLLDIRA